MINILVNGCNGKMGQEVVKQIDKVDDMNLIGGFDKENTGIFTFPVYTSWEEVYNVIYSKCNKFSEKPDAIIDFSVPVATFTMLDFAKEHKIPVVIATTGFTNDELNKIKKYSEYIPIFRSSNMSFDINLMCKIVSWIAPLLSDTDIEITETHHNRKIDSPSGTALMLADKINQALNNKLHYEFNRHDKRSKRDKNEIGFSSIRGGNIVGEHIVQFFGEYESFEIKHTSYSRNVFAEGALKATKFLINKPSGLYNMDDILK